MPDRGFNQPQQAAPRPVSSQPPRFREYGYSSEPAKPAQGVPAMSRKPVQAQSPAPRKVIHENPVPAVEDAPDNSYTRSTLKSEPVQASEQPRRPLGGSRPSRLQRSSKASKEEPPRAKKQKKKSWPKRIFKILGILLLLAVIGFGVRFALDLARMTGSSNPFAFLGALQRTPLKNDNGRVNFLVAGNSADNVGHAGGELTDSIMLLSMDTKKNTAMMLSIPRDLWVDVPGYGHSKINAAYARGGMETLKDVVEDNLDLEVHYTALINYAAFRDLVDAVGGITITINSSDRRGIYDSSLDWTSRTCCALAKYPNGPVQLNGKQALNLARARGEGRGSYGFPQADFTRTEHQRLMLLGIREKAMSSSTLLNPVKLSNMMSAIGTNVSTDVQLKEIQSMIEYGKEIDVNKIDSYNINTLAGANKTMLQNDMIGGQSVLVPAAGIDDYSEIAAQLKKVFNATPVTKEAARTVVLNGTDAVGLARQQGSRLKQIGVDVVIESDATVQPKTTIVDNSKGKKPATIDELKKRYSATVITDSAMSANYPNADIILILGQTAVSNTTANETQQ